MSNEKNVIVLSKDSYGGLMLVEAPDDVVIVIRDYDVPEGIAEDRGGNYMTPEEVEEVLIENSEVGEWGIEVDEDNVLPDGRLPVFHYQKHLLTEDGQYRPSIPIEMYDSFKPENKPELDAMYEKYAKPI